MRTKHSLYSRPISINTEDELFKVLSRPGIHEMVSIFSEWDASNNSSINRLAFMKEFKWDWVEFLIAKKAAGYAS